MIKFDVESILKQMWTFDEVKNNPTHSGNELNHLRGTYEYLKKWGADDLLQLVALCHNAYDVEHPESFKRRADLQKIIGFEAEKIVYLFCSIKPSSLIAAIENELRTVEDAYSGETIKISDQEMIWLINLALANWLEQRPRLLKDQQNLFFNEFQSAQNLILAPAYIEFEQAYVITT